MPKENDACNVQWGRGSQRQSPTRTAVNPSNGGSRMPWGRSFQATLQHIEDRASDDMFDFALFLKYFISRVQDFLDESQWCLILAAISAVLPSKC